MQISKIDFGEKNNLHGHAVHQPPPKYNSRKL